MAEHHSYANLTSTFNVRIGTLGYMTVPHRRGILLRNSVSCFVLFRFRTHFLGNFLHRNEKKLESTGNSFKEAKCTLSLITACWSWLCGGAVGMGEKSHYFVDFFKQFGRELSEKSPPGCQTAQSLNRHAAPSRMMCSRCRDLLWFVASDALHHFSSRLLPESLIGKKASYSITFEGITKQFSLMQIRLCLKTTM